MVEQIISHANIQRTPRNQTTSFDFRKIDVRASPAVADKKPACGVADGRHRLEWSRAAPNGAALRNGGGCRGFPPAKERALASE